MDCGTGKSPTVINMLRQKYMEQRRILPTIIIAPLCALSQLKEEFIRFAGDYYKNEILVVSQKTRDKKIKAINEHTGNIIIINYESVVIKKIQPILIEKMFDVMVLDEVHFVKTFNSLRTKFIKKLSENITYRYGLSGTLILNSIADIWSQADIISPGLFESNYYAFRAKYLYDEAATYRHKLQGAKKNIQVWKARQGADKEVKDLLYENMFTINKRDCLDLPPLLLQQRDVMENDEIMKHYNSLEKDFITFLDSGEACVAKSALVKCLRMQQALCGIFKTDEGNEVIIKPNRLKELKNALVEINGAKTIIWTVFAPTYKQIRDLLDELGLKHVSYTGRESNEEKEEARRSFNEDPDINVFMAHPQSGARALNLTSASYMISYSRTYSLEHRIQSIARMERQGAQIHDKLTLIDLVTPGTIDVTVLEALNKKESVADAIMKFNRRV